MKYDNAIKTIEGCSIGFTQPKYFNDPFDIPYYKPNIQPSTLGDALLQPAREWLYNSTWAENSAILSLTRTPTNPLMWSHYAYDHTGVVIGLNVVKAGLTDSGSNLVPAQFGSIVYVSKRPLNKFISVARSPIAVGTTYHFPIEHYEKLQRLFLHKPLTWSYEEEVRVVKCINGIETDQQNTSEIQSGKFNTILINNSQPLFLYNMPQLSIEEVYMGMRVDDNDQQKLIDIIEKCIPEARIYKLSKDEEKLKLNCKEVLLSNHKKDN